MMEKIRPFSLSEQISLLPLCQSEVSVLKLIHAENSCQDIIMSYLSLISGSLPLCVYIDRNHLQFTSMTIHPL